VVDKVCYDRSGTLAGAAISLADAVAKAISLDLVPPEQALAMASLNPAQFMGLEHRIGRIEAGARADLVRLPSNGDIDCLSLAPTML